MHISLFADRLDRRKPTGIGIYINRVLEHVPIVAPDIDFAALATRTATPDVAPASNLHYQHVGGPRRLNELLWLANLPSPFWIGQQTDLVHALVPMPLHTHRPLVVTIHDLSPIHFPDHYKPTARLVFRAALRHALQRASRLISISQHTADDLVRLFGIERERIAVVHHGIDRNDHDSPPDTAQQTALRHTYQTGERFVLFVGTITHRKIWCRWCRPLSRLPPLCPMSS
ncbi:MAG: glycosyltransferase family 4 protein [Chloroflexaceae bacterium]|nr:glycosyltransferase family 4 protein [Chloroflexaceae bacterium]